MKVSFFIILTLATVSLSSFAQVKLPIGTDFVQLQKLIAISQQQIDSLKEIIAYKKVDSRSIEKATEILQQLALGLDKSIEKYQGTEIYEKALLDLQSKDDFQRTYRESQKLRELAPRRGGEDQVATEKFFEELIQFQKESVKANQSDLGEQKELQDALVSAQPGFVPKIQAQVQLGNWRTSTRVSTQITGILAEMHTMREELRILRLKEDGSNALSILVNGSESQNKKLREASHR